MDPAEFVGREEEWPKWKEATEDYVDAVHPGMKQALSLVAQVKSQVTDRLQVNLTEDGWNLRCNLFMLLKRKMSGEARSLVMCVDHQNGYEAWRLLIGRLEPHAGIRRMKEIAELMALQNKPCKNVTETSLVLLELDRRHRLISEIGGDPPSNDTLVNVLWMAMDPGTRSNISGKIDATSNVNSRSNRWRRCGKGDDSYGR